MAEPVANRPEADGAFQDAQEELAELCRVHHVALEMIERSRNLDELMDRILDEYETRLRDLPPDALDGAGGALPAEAAGKLRGLFLFAAQAAAIKEKAALAQELRNRASELSRANAQLEWALGEAESARCRLDGVLSALDSGILIVEPDGQVQHANPAARRLAGCDADSFDRGTLGSLLDAVPRGTDGEVSVRGEDGDGRVLMVARRELGGDGTSEVVLLSDVTRRCREVEERHRIEKLGEVLKTLSVLSHKINNPLTALMGRAQMLRAVAGTDPRAVKAATVIEESAGRIADLIRELGRVVKEGRQDAVDQVLAMEGPREHESASESRA